MMKNIQYSIYIYLLNNYRYLSGLKNKLLIFYSKLLKYSFFLFLMDKIIK